MAVCGEGHLAVCWSSCKHSPEKLCSEEVASAKHHRAHIIYCQSTPRIFREQKTGGPGEKQEQNCSPGLLVFSSCTTILRACILYILYIQEWSLMTRSMHLSATMSDEIEVLHEELESICKEVENKLR